MLRANGVATTILDLDPDQISALRRFGLKVFYGDATRLDLLHAAGAGSAKLLVLAIDDPERAAKLATQIRHEYPHLTILTRDHITEDDRDFRDSADGAWEPSPPSSEASKISDKDGAASREHVRLRLL